MFGSKRAYWTLICRPDGAAGLKVVFRIFYGVFKKESRDEMFLVSSHI